MAANESKVSMFGFVGKAPVRIGQPESAPVCTFRLGSTPAYYDAAKGAWIRRPTTWITVKAFRNLAVNLFHSLHKGDPVMVTGSLVTEEWTKEGQLHSALVLEADGVGHDLNLGQGAFTRVKPEEVDSPGRKDPWDDRADLGAGNTRDDSEALGAGTGGGGSPGQGMAGSDTANEKAKASTQPVDAF